MRLTRRHLVGGTALAGLGALAGAAQAPGAALAEPLDQPFTPLTAPHLLQAEQMVQYQRLLAAGYLPEGIAGHWPLAGAASDHSGAGRTLSLGTTAGWTAEWRAGGELSLDGTSTAYAKTTAAVNTTAPFTVSAWVRLAALDRMYTAVSQDSGQNSRFLLQYDPDLGWAFKVRDAAGTVKVSAVAPTAAEAGKWVHLTGVSANGVVKLYVNGAPGQPVPTTISWAATGSLHIGQAMWQGATVNWWRGQISDVRVYQRALTDDQVLVISGRKARDNNQYVLHSAAEFAWGNPADLADPAGWIARARCASFITGVLKHTYPWATNEYFRTWFDDDPSPEAEDYRKAFAGNPGPRMRRVEKITDLLPGDLIAIDYSTTENGTPQDNTGHIVMVRQVKAPYAGGPADHPGVAQYPIEIVDCTAEAHGEYQRATYKDFPDTRMVWEDGDPQKSLNFQGVGIGHMFFYADAAGRFAGYRWSVNSGESNTYGVETRPIAAARPL
ncbi:LamG domain-containing protein [Actinoplanes sp. NPDC049548]|uniref:LamG domain-containing protein n=1 Tax=Actinoplanes sp. NPDC049548 TaxID=3155152 RepID=UPI003449CDAA